MRSTLQTLAMGDPLAARHPKLQAAETLILQDSEPDD
jgi:hypothetical protein